MPATAFRPRRFSLLAAEYRQAPEVTRKRLYLETMQEVLARNPKVVGGNDNILYLPIGGNAARTGVPAEAPVIRLPATQAAPAAEPSSERAPRDDRRQGGR